MQPGRMWCRVAEARVGARWGPCCAVLLCACASVSQTGTQSALMQATGAKTSALQLRATQKHARPAVARHLRDRRGCYFGPGHRPRAAKAGAAVEDGSRASLLPGPLQHGPAGRRPGHPRPVHPAGPVPGGARRPEAVGAAAVAGHPGRQAGAPAGGRRDATVGRHTRGLRTGPHRHGRLGQGPSHHRASLLASLPVGLPGGAGGSRREGCQRLPGGGNIPATVGDLATRMDIYSAYLPKAVRWQAELVADELRDQGEIERAMATLVSLQKAADRFNQAVSPDFLQQALARANGPTCRRCDSRRKPT